MREGYFVAACECHLMPPRPDLAYFPWAQKWRESVQRFLPFMINPEATPDDLPKSWNAEDLIEDMDKAGMDVGFGLRESMMDVALGSSCKSTNGWVAEQVEKFPDRLYLEANVGPILWRGVKNAIWEMKYLVNERNAKLVKIYQPEDIGPLNDPAMWPFYEAAQELGIPLTIHLGQAWVPPGKGKYCLPIQMDDVLIDFPELKVIAYHIGWPYVDELIGLAMKHINLYIGISVLLGWFTNSPYRGYHMLGDIVQTCGAHKIIFVAEWPPVDLTRVIDWLIKYDMPDELCEKWGYRKLTKEEKKGILGETLANLTGVEIRKRV